MRRALFGIMLLAVATLAPPSGARAQTTITLEGTVLNEQGAPIGDAQVALREVATGESRRATTGQTGGFRFLGLASGRYEVTARFIGYAPATEVVQLVVGQRARLTFRLEQGATELAAVQVTDERVRSVEVQRTSVSTPVLQAEIKNLPLNTRNVMSLAAIAPGIRSYAPAQGRAIPSAGSVPDLRFINLYLDGVEMKSLFNGNLVGIPQTGSPLPADALEEFRVLLNPYDAEYTRAGAYVISGVTRRGTNDFEGSAFGFFQNQEFIARTELQRNANQQLADFGRQQVGLNLRGPFVRDRLFYAASYELSTQNSYIDVVPGRPTANPDVWNAYAGSFKVPNNNHTGLLRLTYAPSERHNLDAFWTTRYLTGEGNFGAAVAQSGGISQKYFINTGQLRHKWLPTPRVVNELSFQVVRWSHDEPQLAPGAQLTYPGLTLGTAGFPLEIHETHLRLVDRATYSVDDWFGSHILKAGVEVARVSGDQFFPINRDGFFRFPTDDPAALPDLGRIGLGFVNPVGDRDAYSELSGWVTGVYVNDEWRPRRNLTVNLGLRYDAELNTLNNDFTVPWASDPELAAAPALRGFLNRGDRKNDLNNVSPRVSFSWDVFDDNRTFLRGGFGIMYDRVPSFMGFQERRDATWRTYDFANPGTTDPEVLRELVRGGTVTAAPSFTVLKDKMETPENRQLSVGFARQITDNLGLNLDYIHQEARHLYARINANWLNTATNERAISQRYGDIILWDDFARAELDALVGTLTYQRGDVRLNAAYTLGYSDAEYDAVTAPAYPFRSSYAMQPTSGDERHRFVLSGLGTLPFGLTLSTITTLASPRPYLTFVGVDRATPPNPEAPDAVGNGNNLFDDDWIDGKRYRRPSNAWKNWYRTVDVRLTQRLPSVAGTQLSVIGEVFNLFNTTNYAAFAGRQYNANGQPLANFGQPNVNFGARQVQVGARAEF